MDGARPSNESLNLIKLRLESQKFLDLIVDTKTLTLTGTYGDLENGKVVDSSVTKEAKQFDSKEDMDSTLNNVLSSKMDEGYQLLEEEKSSEAKELSETGKKNVNDEPAQEKIEKPCSVKSIPLKPELWDYIDDINRKAVELDIEYEPANDSIKVSGNEVAITKFSEFISTLSQMQEKEEEEEKKESEEETLGPFIQRELKLAASAKACIREVEARANDFQLIYQDLDDKIVVAGYQANVLNFLTWLYELTVLTTETEIKKIKEERLSEQHNEFSQKELGISTFHRMKKNEILQKADDLKIICDFGYDVILAAGESDSLREFKSYLHELETNAKRMLYPRYWDFHDINPYIEIDVPKGSDEFREVSLLFNRSLNNIPICKITRIQNRYLMETYVTMLQKRQELRPGVEVNRKLLFHGTRQINPAQIYKDSDTGFDLQFANQGMYGRGLYFAIDANYSHNGYRYDLGNGRCQMILADVFIGKPFQSQPNNSYKKAPVGYDSVEAVGGFYIVYNNFHSYPLYLIEYEAGNQSGSISAHQSQYQNIFNQRNHQGHSSLFAGHPAVSIFGNQQSHQNNQHILNQTHHPGHSSLFAGQPAVSSFGNQQSHQNNQHNFNQTHHPGHSSVSIFGNQQSHQNNQHNFNQGNHIGPSLFGHQKKH